MSVVPRPPSFGPPLVVGVERKRSNISGRAPSSDRSSAALVRSSSVAFAAATKQVAKKDVGPLFQFRRGTRELPVEANPSPQRSTTKPVDDLADHRLATMASATYTYSSLAHLVIEGRRDVLPLDRIPEIGSSVQDDGQSIAIHKDNSTDSLWQTVTASNFAAREQRYAERHESVSERVNPRWWRHLSLHHFSDFLTPGLFTDAELDAVSSSDEDECEGGRSATGAIATPNHSDVLGNATTSSRWQPANTTTSALYISNNTVSPWTQHVTTRPASHWMTPRRHGVHNGKSFGEIGTMTTVSFKDYIATANSLIGICQTEERTVRMEIERSERSAAAMLYHFRTSTQRQYDNSCDALLMLSVAETQEREDLFEQEEQSLENDIMLSVLLPAEVACAESARNRSIVYYLEVFKAKQPTNELVSIDDEIAKML